MRAELLPTQRHLVGMHLRMADRELVTKYVFPFVDASWTVPFTLVDAMTQGPRIFRGPLEFRSGGLTTPESSSALRPVASVPLERFGELVHFDPWWSFRGIAGVERPWVDAVLASNLAGTFFHEGTTYKVHDLAFDPALKTLDALVAKDSLFRNVSLRKGDVDLLLLRPPVRA